jgi:pilus assembly protein Flp/PilA
LQHLARIRPFIQAGPQNLHYSPIDCIELPEDVGLTFAKLDIGLECSVSSFRCGKPAISEQDKSSQNEFGFLTGTFQAAEKSMKSFIEKVQRFIVSEDGPTAVEYAVMLALIIIICITAIRSIGTNANATFEQVGAELG